MISQSVPCGITSLSVVTSPAIIPVIIKYAIISKLLCLPRLDIRRIVVYAAADKAAPKIATKANQVKPVKLNGFTITITATKIKRSHLPAPLGTRSLRNKALNINTNIPDV